MVENGKQGPEEHEREDDFVVLARLLDVEPRAPAPTAARESGPDLVPEPEPEPEPEPKHEHEPEHERALEPEPAPEAAPVPEPPPDSERELHWEPAPRPEPTTPPAQIRPGVLLAGRFEVLALVGAGPHGTVWRVRDHNDEARERVLKVLRDERTRDDACEARCRELLARFERLSHPTIVRLRDVGRTDDGRVWLVWDRVRGRSLREIGDRAGPLPPRRALEIARQILQGLERGHAVGLVHGGLSPDNVLLADRVSASEENPYAVGVQLLDHGLRPLVQDRAAAPEEDLAAAGRLLVELLTGERIAVQDSATGRGGLATRGAAAVLAEAQLPASVRQIAFRAVTTQPRERYRSARAFRAAIERSRAWRGPRRLTAGWVAAAVLGLGAAGAFGFLWVRAAGGWQEVRASMLGTADSAGATGDGAQAAERTGTLAGDAWRAEAEEARAERDRLAVEKADLEERVRMLEEQAPGTSPELVAGLRTELADARRAEEETRTRLEGELGGAQKTAENERQRAETATQEAARLGEENAALAARVAEAEGRAIAAERANDPLQRSVAHLERILARLEERDGAGARSALEAYAADPAADPDGGSRAQEVPFLEHWVAAAEALDAADVAREEHERADALARGRASVEGAEASEQAFVDLTANRLDAAAGTARGARVERALAELEAELARREGELAESLETRFAAVLADASQRTPDEVVPLATRLGPERVEEFLARYVADALAAAERGNELEARPLVELTTLADWARHVADDADLAKRAVGLELLRLDFARGLATGAPSERSRAAAAEGPMEVGSGWRSVLTLKARLLGTGSSYPGPDGAAFLYHASTPDGEESWQWETVRADAEPVEESDASWTVTQRFLDVRGVPRGERTLQVLRRGARFYEVGPRERMVLDLGEADYEVRSWSPGALPDLPEPLPVTSRELFAFRAELSSRGWTSLVRAGGAWRTWYCPELGMVRHADPRRITRELVFVRR